MEATGSGIWQERGSSPSPHLIILGGVHGDEKTGIEVVKNLHTLFHGGEEGLSRGTLTLVLGNEEAIRINQRGTSPEHNLNRLFTKHHLSGPVLDFPELLTRWGGRLRDEQADPGKKTVEYMKQDLPGKSGKKD